MTTDWVFLKKQPSEKDRKANKFLSEMFLPYCIYIWRWEHFIYGFCYMGHPDPFRCSLLASKLTDLSGPSADIETTPCITRECCDLKVNMTGLWQYLLQVEKNLIKNSWTKNPNNLTTKTREQRYCNVNYIIRIPILLTKTNRNNPPTPPPQSGHHKFRTELLFCNHKSQRLRKKKIQEIQCENLWFSGML